SQPKDSLFGDKRRPFAQAEEVRGKQQLGGAILQVDLDLTHPLAFGYRRSSLPIYLNTRVFLKPSKNPYSTVAQYTAAPHLDGYVAQANLDSLKNSAAVLVSSVGQGRAIMFAFNPNFRGSWWGTNKLFFNAIFFGSRVFVP
ncbi:MAG: zinc carboxypeptidase, partial [Bacteroidota bacterium]